MTIKDSVKKCVLCSCVFIMSFFINCLNFQNKCQNKNHKSTIPN